MKNIFTLFLLAFASLAHAQTQTLKGRITDAQTLLGLPGATVVLIGSEPLNGTATDAEGYFKLANVPVGRQELAISLIGYQTRRYPNTLVTTGKEVVLNLALEEKVMAQDEVIITARKGAERQQATNEFALLSARSFDIEETRRYAGSRNDPARMASNFAGVSGVNDGRNDIVIRGNSPTGLLWRLEGADIFNPSHFGSLGATGGPVGMLNNNTLERSDFITGAFPAQYGNALGGVFDLGIRTGNQEKREYLGQIGFNGFEGGVEGPFSENSRASYLANYRYSTLAVVSKLGVSFGTGSAVPYYQDATFKIHVPTAKAGTFTLWGVGGFSNIHFDGRDADTTSLYSDPYSDTRFATRSGVIGASHLYHFSPNTYGKLMFNVSASENKGNNDSLTPEKGQVPNYVNRSTNTRQSVRYVLGHKFNPRLSLTAGVLADRLGFYFQDSTTEYVGSEQAYRWRKLHNAKDNGVLLQTYVQTLYKFTDQLSATVGLHQQSFSLSGSNVIEPRAAVRYQVGRQEFSLASGLHSQLHPLAAYIIKTKQADGSYTETNRKLDFSRSLHLVAGYGLSLSENTRLKVETYYQHLFNIPVETRKSYYSLLNEGADFNYPETDSLQNTGTGRNLGLETTLERSFAKGYYFLVTASVFDSKYKGSNGIEKNTAFNGQYIFNVLAGKEFSLGKKLVLALDLKLTTAGGRRYTPINEELSRLRFESVEYKEQSFDKQLDDYFRADLKVTLRFNGQRAMQEFFVDVQNITNRENPYTRYWDARRGRTIQNTQLGLFPNVNYRIQF